MKPGTIDRVVGRRVWDSRGRPTVEADVILASGNMGRAIAPAGASRGRYEAVELRDAEDTVLYGFGVDRAVATINTVINEALRGREVSDQAAVDGLLRELDGTGNKSRLGGNSVIAVSMATAHAAAHESGQPLYRYLLGDRSEVLLPLPEIQIFGGGAHAGSRVDFQDFMVMPGGAQSFSEALEWCARVYMAAGRLLVERGAVAGGVADEGGYWPDFRSNEEAMEMLIRAIEAAGFVPGEDLGISIDVAASEFFDGAVYSLSLDGKQYDRDGLCELLADWTERYPLWSIEDPLSQDDFDGMQQFTSALGDRVQVIGDDFLVTDAGRITEAARKNACNAVLIKPNQVGTLTEAREALDAARQAGWGTIVSARSGESEDTTIAHLAVGWSAGQLKVGSMARSERLAKWNEVIRIEEAVGERAVYAGKMVLPFEKTAGRIRAGAGVGK